MDQKRNIKILLSGILVALLVGFFFDAFPQMIGIIDYQYHWRLGPVVTAIQALIILPLIIRYNFVVFPIESLALDIFNSATDGIVLYNVNGVILNINEKAEQELNINFSENLNHNIKDVFDNYDFNKEIKNFTTSLKNNPKTPFLISQSKIKLEYPRNCMLLIFKNITEEKQLSEQLTESEEKFRYLFDRAPVGIFRLELDGTVLEINQIIQTFLGVESADELNNRGIGSLFNEKSQYENLFTSLNENNYIANAEVELNGKSNETIIAKLNAQIINDKDGKPQFIEGIIDNITESKEAKKRLRTSEENYRKLVETANDIIYNMDINGCYTYVNPVLTRITGYSKEDALGKDAVIHVREDYKEKVKEFYINQFKQRISDTYLEIPILIKDGSIMWVGNSAHLVKEGDIITGFNVIARDITELKRIEHVKLVMYELSKIVNSDLPINDLFKNIHSCLTKLMDTTNFFIATYDKKEDLIRFTQNWDTGDDITEIENASKTNSVTAKVILTGKSLFLNENQLMDLYKNEDTPYGEISKVWAGVPMKIKGDVIGAIAVQSYDDPNCYTKDDLEILESVSEHIGIAIHRSKSEEELRESKESLIRAQQIAHFGNWDQNHPSGDYFWSDESKRIFGFDIDEKITSEKFWERVHPDDLDWMKETWEKNEKELHPYQGTFRIIRPDGDKRIIFERAEFISNDKGELLKTIGTIMDITDQEETKRALEKTEQDYRLLVESSTDIIYQLDVNGFYTYVNPVLEIYSEYKTKDLLGKNALDFVVPEQRENVSTVYNNQFLNRTLNVKMEMLVRSKSGKEYWLETNSRLIMDGDHVNGYYTICRDITERKQTEIQLKKTQNQLKQLSSYLQTLQEEERKRIAREIHDELGQNLTGINMDIAYLKNRSKEGNVDSKIVERLNSLSKLTEYTIQITRRISQELRPSILDDLGLIPAIEWQIKEFCDRTKIKIESKLPQEGSDFDVGHATAIFRIIQEALTNITKHSKAKKVNISLKQGKDKLLLIVQDDGKGITDEEINRGKSFGLMGMQERANIWGGNITFEGVKNKGTKVIVNIPTLQ